MALFEGCFAAGVVGTAILTYRFFAFTMPPQAEESVKRRFLLLFWWILGYWVKCLVNTMNEIYLIF